MAFQFPWTNLHELNLDWFLSKFKQFTNNFLETTATAESVPYGTQPSVTVTGGELDDDTDVTDPFTFNFKIPAGQQGEQGVQGNQGVPGQDGFSPIATVTKSGDTATISITDKNGTTTATVRDGTFQLDRTLSMSNAAAPADLVGDLKSAFDDAIDTVIVGASANLFNPATTTDGKRISSTGVLVDNSAFRVSDYIPVAPGDILYTNAYTTELTVTNAYPDFCTYTADKVFVQRYVEVDTRINGFVVPADIYYIRVSENYYHNYNRTLMVSIGNRLTTATPYDSGIEKNELKNAVTFYEDFKVIAYGDSMVELGDWEIYLSSIIGCPVANMGIGGTKLANRNKQYWIDDNGKYKGEATDPQPAGTTLRWDAISGYPVGASDTNDRIDCIPTDTDICLVEFGTNDLHQNTPLGTWADTDNNSFRGAMKLCASRIRTRANQCKVIFVTPTAERTDFVNNLNLTKKDYIAAMLEAELEINVPVINLFALTSWSTENYANYSTDNLHWNTEGQKIVARIIGGYLLAQKPFPFE